MKGMGSYGVLTGLIGEGITTILLVGRRLIRARISTVVGLTTL